MISGASSRATIMPMSICTVLWQCIAPTAYNMSLKFVLLLVRVRYLQIPGLS